jgi:hypothetical protein
MFIKVPGFRATGIKTQSNSRKRAKRSFPMKTTLVRAAVLSLALVGFGAATVANKAMAAEKSTASVKGVPSIPHCAPGETCGLD